MTHLPELPHNVPRDQRQVDGDMKADRLAETHRRNKELAPKPSEDQGKRISNVPTGPLRYREEEA